MGMRLNSSGNAGRGSRERFSTMLYVRKILRSSRYLWTDEFSCRNDEKAHRFNVSSRIGFVRPVAICGLDRKMSSGGLLQVLPADCRAPGKAQQCRVLKMPVHK